MDVWVRMLLLSVGGALGVNARYFMGMWVSRWAGQQYPWATFTINVTGSFAIGFLTMLLGRWLPHQNYRLLVVTGFLGGYTTYSAFAFESLTLWERGEKGLSLAYATSTLIAGFLAVALGVTLARTLAVPQGEPPGPSNNQARIESHREATQETSETGVHHESGRGEPSSTLH